VVSPDLSVEVGSVRLKNPVLTASGTFGYGLEFLPYLDLERLGGLVSKGLSPKPRKGNPPERIVYARTFRSIERLLQDVSGLAITALRCVYHTEICEKSGANDWIGGLGPGE